MTHFGFALDLSDIDLWNIDLLDTHLDLLDTDITSKHFVCLQDILKSSWRYVFQTSSRHVLKTSWRRLQHNNFSSSKRSSRQLQDVLEDVKLLRWRRVEVVLKTSSRSTNVCWVVKMHSLFLQTVCSNKIPTSGNWVKLRYFTQWWLMDFGQFCSNFGVPLMYQGQTDIVNPVKHLRWNILLK